MAPRRTRQQVWGPRFRALEELRDHFKDCCGREHVLPSLDVAVSAAATQAAGWWPSVTAQETQAAWRCARTAIEADAYYGCDYLEWLTLTARKAMRI